MSLLKLRAVQRILEYGRDKVNHALISNKNGHRVEIMEFNDSGKILVRVDKGEVVTLSSQEELAQYVEEQTQ